MRTIKFKARRLDNKEWVCGYFYEENYNTYIIENRQNVSKLNRNIPHKVDYKTVAQNTGFYDRNGKEIYEGDVLRSDIYPFSRIEDNKRDNYFGIIGWNDETAMFYIMTIKNPESSVVGFSDGHRSTLSQDYLQEFEVVGSILDKKWQERLNLKFE